VSGTLRIAIVLAAAVAATIVANFVLLGVATGRQDPVGRLSPHTGPPRPAATAPAAVRLNSRPRQAREAEHRDD